MKKSLIIAALSLANLANANAQTSTNQTYSGNGNTSFGGAVGNGSLQISNNGAGALDFTFTRGGGNFSTNNALVIYFDSISGGDASTANYTDTADGLRRAISGFDAAQGRSTLNFGDGFGADYAIALNNGFAGLWSLSNPANFAFQKSANLSPTGEAQTAYTFSINVADIGLTADSGQSFSFFDTYISETAFRSAETLGAGYQNSPSAGWNTFDAADVNSFTTVPEPSTVALLTLSALGVAGYAARRRARK
jgi:trimeric autotransporter adhesin